MRALVVRVQNGRLLVEEKVIAAISRGFALFVGIEESDKDVDLERLAQRVVNLRIFENEQGKLHYSVRDKNYQILCISNFTLCANTKKGRRPSFEDAMGPDEARRLFEGFANLLRSKGVNVQTGSFGKHMDIELLMDGPVNIVLES